MPPRSTAPSRTLPYAAIAGILILLLVGGVVLAARDGGDDADLADGTGTTPVTEPPADVSTSAPPATEDTEPEPATTAPTADEDDDEDDARERPEGVPPSWQPFTAPSIGWSIWHPPSWQPTKVSGNAYDIRDPSSGSYLRVDYVQPPSGDPVAAWEESSARFAERYPDYEELRIEPTTYQGYDAAIWEYTYEGQRATNLGFVTPGTGFALNFQSSASAWDDTQDLRRAFEAGFTVPG